MTKQKQYKDTYFLSGNEGVSDKYFIEEILDMQNLDSSDYTYEDWISKKHDCSVSHEDETGDICECDKCSVFYNTAEGKAILDKLKIA